MISKEYSPPILPRLECSNALSVSSQDDLLSYRYRFLAPGVGVEPTTWCLTDICWLPLSYPGMWNWKLAARRGFEPLGVLSHRFLNREVPYHSAHLAMTSDLRWRTTSTLLKIGHNKKYKVVFDGCSANWTTIPCEIGESRTHNPLFGVNFTAFMSFGGGRRNRTYLPPKRKGFTVPRTSIVPIPPKNCPTKLEKLFSRHHATLLSPRTRDSNPNLVFCNKNVNLSVHLSIWCSWMELNHRPFTSCN